MKYGLLVSVPLLLGAASMSWQSNWPRMGANLCLASVAIVVGRIIEIYKAEYHRKGGKQ